MMDKIMAKLVYFQNEAGATMIEYGLIVGLVSVVAILALTAVGNDLAALYNRIDGILAPLG